MTSEERFWKCLQLGEEIHKKISKTTSELSEFDPDFNCPGGIELGQLYDIDQKSNDLKLFSLNSYSFDYSRNGKENCRLYDVIEMCKVADEVSFSNYGNDTNLVVLNVKVKGGLE